VTARGRRRRALFASVVLTGAGAAGAAAATWLAGAASAQTVDPRRPTTLTVGAPGGASPIDRVDAQRTGLSRAPLPTGALHVAWRRALGASIDHAPIAVAGGDVVAVVGRGDLVTLDRDGDERGRATIGGGASGPPASLSDGTIVVVTSAADAVFVIRGAPRFRTHLGGERALAGGVSPLALDDGGVVVGVAHELTALDARGGVRARAALPEPIHGPLLSGAGKVIAVTISGAIYGWSPGREAERLGSFGGPVDGGAAFSDARTLVGVVEGARLQAVDLVRGSSAPRAVAGGTYFLGPPAMRGAAAYLLAETPGRDFLLTLDAAGQETGRALVATSPPPTLADGGAAPYSAAPHVGPVVDRAGAVAFATPDGRVGMVSATGAVDTLGESICGRGSAARGGGAVVGLTPVEGGFVVACDGGGIAKIVGS